MINKDLLRQKIVCHARRQKKMKNLLDFLRKPATCAIVALLMGISVDLLLYTLVPDYSLFVGMIVLLAVYFTLLKKLPE
jgi:hypothetical protein